MLKLERVVHMTTGVYKLTNKANGKCYIGGSLDVHKRRTEHFKPSRIERLNHLPLYEAISKYGKNNFEFEILEETNEDDLVEREEFYIKEFNSVEDGYNVSSTALNLHDEDLLVEHSRKLSERNKKNWTDPEYRKRITESSRAYQATVSDEERENAVKALNEYTDSIKLPVGQYDKAGNLIETYEGVREAERALGLPNDSVGKVCRGVKYRKTAGGFVWKYLTSEV